MLKNTASQIIGAQMVSATDGSAFTGAVTVSVTGDGGTQATGSVGSGACTHEGNGYHTYAPAQAETNYDLIAFTFTGTGAVPVTVQVFTTANLIAAIATAVWAAGTRSLTTFGSLVSDVASAAWAVATSALTSAGTIGKLIVDNLNEPVSSRATASEVNDEVDTALADYDGPTNAEMEARTLAAASYATAANQSTILNRIGAWTGSGVNTLLGAFKALLSKAASTPSDIGGTFDPSTDSTEAIRDTEPLGTAMRGTDGANTTAPLDATQTQAAAAAAITAADPPTRAEATADKDEILAILGTPADTDLATDIANVDGGSGGDATAANQTTIITHLTDIKGGTFNGSTDSNEAIRNAVDAIDIGAGSGDTEITAATLDDEGETLAYENDGEGIEGGLVRFYVASEYATSGLNATLRARTTTLDDGTFANTLSLSSGVAYTVHYRHPSYADHTTTLTVD